MELFLMIHTEQNWKLIHNSGKRKKKKKRKKEKSLLGDCEKGRLDAEKQTMEADLFQQPSVSVPFPLC